MRWQAVQDDVGDEHAPEVMGAVVHGPTLDRVDQPSSGHRGSEHLQDAAVRERMVLGVDATLEQPRRGGKPHPFVVVVGADQRDRSQRASNPADDLGEHVGQLRADHEEPFLVGLRRRDLQQRDQLAGGGKPVLHQAVVAELEEFFDPDAGGAQHLHDRPDPEGKLLFQGQVAALPGGVGCPDAVNPASADEDRPRRHEGLSW